MAYFRRQTRKAEVLPMLYGIFHATISACVWWAFVTAGKGNLQLVLAALAQILVAASFAVVNPYVNERFSTSVRSTGFGLGWSMGVIIPAFFAFYMNWLSNFMPYTATPAVLLAIGGILVAVGAFVGPETKVGSSLKCDLQMITMSYPMQGTLHGPHLFTY